MEGAWFGIGAALHSFGVGNLVVVRIRKSVLRLCMVCPRDRILAVPDNSMM
jgi:hypothetical protein